MSGILFTTAFNLMEYWIFILIMQYVCAARMNLFRRNCVTGTFISLIMIAASACVYGDGGAYAAMVLAVLLTAAVSATGRLNAVLRFIPAYIIYFTLTVIPVAMLQILSEVFGRSLVIGGYGQNITGIVLDVILLVMLITLAHAVDRYHIAVYFGTKEVLGSIALLFFTFIDGQLLALANRQPHGPAMHMAYSVIFTGAYLFGVIYYAYGVADTWKSLYHRTKVSTEMEYMKIQLASMQDSKEEKERTMRMRHDLNKHLAVMKTLCDEGRFNEVCRYADQLNRENTVTGGSMPTGNETADLVVGQKKRLCMEKGIKFTFEGVLSGMDKMSAPDICGLLANAYDNAIEACAVQDGAYIHTRVSSTQKFVVIEIVNSVEKRVPVHKNVIRTSKKDKGLHGHGTNIMKQIACKYNGRCEFQCGDKEFSVRIILPA